MSRAALSNVAPLHGDPVVPDRSAGSPAGDVALRRKPVLLGETADPWLSGLASLAFFAIAFVFIDKNSPTSTAGWTAYYLGFVINWPHFAASYQLLYKETPRRWRDWKFLWAALVSPAILIGAFTVVFVRKDHGLMAWMIQAMFFFVGWHYSKQTYGITLANCHVKNYRLPKPLKMSLLLSMLSLWLLNWFQLNTTTTVYKHYGFSYSQFGFPTWLGSVLAFNFGLSCLAVVVFGTRHYLKTGERPPLAALGTWLAMIVWYLPMLYHPAFFIFIPFFHSLQYLLCVAAVRGSKVRTEEARVADPERRRARTLRRHALFFGSAAVLGYLFFEGLPQLLDRQFPQPEFMGGEFFIASFVLFINIHHYFIDNVIWRQGFGEMQVYLTKEGSA